MLSQLPFGLTRYSTDYWGAYTRHRDPDVHCPGTRNTQKIERNHVTRLPVSAAASQRAVTLLHTYGLTHGLGIPDALIAATALEGDHTLVTSNRRHLRFIAGVRLEQAPYRLPQSDPAP